MQAVAVRKFRGEPELMELPRPEIQSGEVLVRVLAAGVNPFDWKIADGLFEGKRPHRFPLILGVDACGVVETTAPDARRFAPGDTIFGQFFHDPIGDGTYAQYSTTPEKKGVAKVPPGVTPVQAAAVPTAGMTALDAIEALGLKPGATLLIVGAGGGVGSFATQLAATWGIRVIATARESDAARMRSLGAAEIVDHTKAPVTTQLRSSHPEGVDGLLDVISDPPRFAELAGLVRPGGAAATTAYAADPSSLEGRKVRAVNIDMQPRADLLERVSAEIVAGRLRVPVESQVSLEEAPAAFTRARQLAGRGKTVIVL